MDETKAVNIAIAWGNNMIDAHKANFERIDESEQNALTWNELKEIILDSETLFKEFKPEIEIYKGYILGKCAKALYDKN